MKGQFDNNKVNDGKSRIAMPTRKGGGGKLDFSKCVIFLVILALIIFYFVLVSKNIKTEKITEQQWIDMLSDSFGIENVEDLKGGSDEIASGRYAAVTVMRVVGRNNLAYLSGKDVLSDADLITLAADYDVVNGRQMNKNLSKDDAQAIIELAEEFYYDPYNYPEYYEAVFKDNVIENSDLDVISYDEDQNTAQIHLKDGELDENSSIILEVEPGVYKAFSVVSAWPSEDGLYSVELGNIEKIEDVVEYINFSGTVDFSSVFYNTIQEDGLEEEETEEEASVIVKNANISDSASLFNNSYPVLLTANMQPVRFEPMLSTTNNYHWWNREYWTEEAKAEREAEKEAEKAAREAEKEAKKAENEAKKEAKEDKKSINEDFQANVDLEMGGKIKATAQSGGKASYAYSQYAKFSTENDEGEETTAKFEVSVNNAGKVKISPALDDFSLDVEIDQELKQSENDDDIGISGSAEDSLSYKVSVKDLAICGSTYFQKTDWDDEKNYVDFRISGDVEVEGKLTGEIEGKFPIYEKEWPIPVTGGIVSVKLRFYLVATVTGDLYVTYEIDNIHSSVYVSQKGVDVNAGVDGTDFDFNAKIKLEVGPNFEVALDVLGFDVLDPSIDARVVASAETLPKNEGYEEYEKCVQTLIAGPTLELNFIGDDNVLNKILNQFDLSMSLSYTFIEEDDAPLRKDLHIETELDGTIVVYEGKADEVCTHVEKEEDDKQSLQDHIDKKKNDAKNKVNDEIDKKKKEAEDEAEKWFEEWVNKNCGGCC